MRNQLLALVLTCGFAVSAFAQKAPELGYAFPPAIEIGTKQTIQLGGYDLTTDSEFFSLSEHLQLEIASELGPDLVPSPPYWFGEKGRLTAFPIPRELEAEVRVSSKASPGLYRWQAANANGSSATAVLLASSIRETIENRFRREPQKLDKFPVGVSGRLERIAEVDEYEVQATRDGLMSIELHARRLGANFHGVLQVRDEDGRIIADVADTQGRDLAATFATKSGHTYRVRLHDLDFRGNRAFVYRLAFYEGPRVLATIPAAGTRGATQQIQFLGPGLKTGDATRIETITREVVFPKTSGRFRYRLDTELGDAVPIEFPLANADTARQPDAMGRVNLPADITAQLDSTRAFTWSAAKGKTYRIEAQSQAIGGRLDLSLIIEDANGKKLAEHDDATGSTDSRLKFKAPADGNYVCRVLSLSADDATLASRVFRLLIEEESMGFALTTQQQLNIPIGGSATLTVKAERFGGHQSPIELSLENLPPGVEASGLTIAKGKSQAKVKLTCSADASSLARPIRVSGKAEGEADSVVVFAPGAGNLAPRDPREENVSQVLVATTLRPTFTVQLVDKNRQRAVHRGTTYPAPFTIARDEGFDGEIRLRMAARQGRHRQGIHAPEFVVPAGAKDVLYPCFMPEWLETDRTTRMVVLGVAAQKDPQGNIRQVTKLADARVTMILEGALLSLRAEASELIVQPGEPLSIPLSLSRSPKLQTPATISLEPPEELRGMLVAQPQTVDVNQQQAVLRVDTIEHPRLRGRWKLKIKATTKQDGKWNVVSQTESPVHFRAASAGP